MPQIAIKRDKSKISRIRLVVSRIRLEVSRIRLEISTLMSTCLKIIIGIWKESTHNYGKRKRI
jgi:hypothetical protein